MSWIRYLIAFGITAVIFATALYISDRLNTARIENIRTIQDNIAIDILSLETQFDLLQELSCTDIRENSVLSRELANLSRRLAYTEENLGTENEEVLQLKRQYTLLQIKDLILMRRVAQKCKLEPVFILYFYSNQDDCPDCERQGYVLTKLSEDYPQLRIYSFDYHIGVPALETLATINNVPAQLPVLVINDKAYSGFKSIEDVSGLVPNIEDLTEAATSTVKKNTPSAVSDTRERL